MSITLMIVLHRRAMAGTNTHPHGRGHLGPKKLSSFNGNVRSVTGFVEILMAHHVQLGLRKRIIKNKLRSIYHKRLWEKQQNNFWRIFPPTCALVNYAFYSDYFQPSKTSPAMLAGWYNSFVCVFFYEKKNPAAFYVNKGFLCLSSAMATSLLGGE